MRVLITGITGAVGPLIAEQLIKCGHDVHGLSRSGNLPNHLLGKIALFKGDITNAEDVYKAMEQCDIVIHLAALLHIVNPPTSLHLEYQRINVDGTRVVVDVACRTQVKRIIYFSTISVYGPTNGKPPVNEQSPRLPQTLYARTKAEAEDIALSAIDADGSPLTTILRLAAVYGPGMKGNYPRLLQAMRRGYFLPVGRGGNRRTLVHVADVATAVLTILNHQESRGQIYNVTDGYIHTMQEIQQTMYHALGKKPPTLFIPHRIAMAAGAVLEKLSFIPFLPPNIGRNTIEKFVEDVAVEGEKIKKELGFQPNYTLTKGWASLSQETVS
jgi:nucleoside-diphosphate-sugar epimerase